MLYRVFPYIPDRNATEEGGALYVPRERQGPGRHDNPEHYGAMYMSRLPESAVAERIGAFRGQVLTDEDLLRRDGSRYALVALDDSALGRLIDLDDPSELLERDLRPSTVATSVRATTQQMALSIHLEGGPGFAWWSTLEASWSNVTLFAERAAPGLAAAGDPEPLSVDHPSLRRASEAMGVGLP